MGKSWIEKLNTNNPKHGLIKECPEIWSKGGELKTMLIPEPKNIDALVGSIQFGKVVTMGSLRARLAKDAGADMACPMTTGIFLKIVAFAAEENRELGNPVTPYWRVVKDDGKLNDKFPEGVTLHGELLESEGHKLITNKSGKARFLEEIDEFSFE